VSEVLESLRGGLVVSVQAPDGSPLAAGSHLAAVARAAELGGAAGIRTVEVASVKEAVGVPVIGLRKRRVEGSDVNITPSLEDARGVAAAGADIVAVDATLRPRPEGGDLASLVAELTVPVLADVDCFEAGLAAREAGAAAVATTLAGYTDAAAGSGPVRASAGSGIPACGGSGAPASAGAGTPASAGSGAPASAGSGAPASAGPDLHLVEALAAELDCPVFAEGRIATPAQARAAFDAGAFAVVVGAAITDPVALTRGFAAATPLRSAHAAY
jgi:N-acylglucosamine-6-phosphate 2-epimerase